MSITYQQAKRIRKTGLMSLFADQLMYEKKVTTAIRKTVSLKTRGRMMGLTQYLDPLNIAKMLTLGSSLGPALLGHWMGRDPRDIQYFTGRLKPIREKSKTGDKITKLSGQGGGTGEMSVILRKMYKLMATTHEENTKRLELNKNREEERQMEDERRHKELLQALGGIGRTTIVSGTAPEEGDGFMGSLLKSLKDWAEKLLFSLVDKALKAFEWLKDVTAWGKNLLMGLDWAAFAQAFINSTPAMTLLVPFMLSALEKEKIRQNPTAPEYKDNPYAMFIRGEAKTEGQATEINKRKTTKQVPRNTIKEFVNSNLDDKLLMQELGADKRTLEEWLKSHTKESDMWQAPVAKLAGTEVGASQVGTVSTADKTGQTRIAQETRAEFAKTDPRLVTNAPVAEKLNSTVAENVDTKINALVQKSTTSTQYNNTSVNSQSDKTVPINRQIPSVRMQEPEFQNRIYSNTVPAN